MASNPYHLLDTFHKHHFSIEQRNAFFPSITSSNSNSSTTTMINTPVQSQCSDTKSHLSNGEKLEFDLTPGMIDMFRFSENYRRESMYFIFI